MQYSKVQCTTKHSSTVWSQQLSAVQRPSVILLQKRDSIKQYRTLYCSTVHRDSIKQNSAVQYVTVQYTAVYIETVSNRPPVGQTGRQGRIQYE